MIHAIAIDDEPLALNVLENFCARIENLKLVKTFTRPQEALQHLQKFPVDMLFLDVRMPSIGGIEFKKQLPDELPVVFTTAYFEYAVEGFDVNAVDYLLKPFSFERFAKAVEKVKHHFTLRHAAADSLSGHMLIRADYSLIKVMFHEITLIEGLDDYIKIHLQDQRPVVARLTMKGMMAKLPADRFVRIHRSFIVPLSHIESVRNKVVSIPGHQLPIGLSYEGAFFEKFRKA